MGVLDGLIGAILVATILSSILFGVLTVQVQSYFSRFPGDAKWMKVMVGSLWLVDCAHQISTCLLCYDYMIKHYHDPSHLLRSTRPLSVTVTLEPISAVIAQCYFARRLYMLNRKWWPVVALTIVLATCAFGFAVACGVLTYVLPFLEDYKRYTWVVAGWLITCCVCDMVISSAIACQLWTSRSGFKPTDKLLTKLTLWTVNTGIASAAVALFDMVTFIRLNNSLVHLGANIVLAKLYSNSVVAFLNRRKSKPRFQLRHVSGTGGIHMSTFVSATTKSFNISPIPNPRSTLDNPVRFEVSKHEFVDPEPECDCKEVPVPPPHQDSSQHWNPAVGAPNTASLVIEKLDPDTERPISSIV